MPGASSCALSTIESISPGCVYYFDTDSIFYLSREGMPLLSNGMLLGDLTLEIGVDEEVIEAFFLSPKNYAYIKRNKITGAERTTVKVKGITLDAKALETLTSQTLMDLAQKYCHQGLTVERQIEQSRIKSRPDQQVLNQEFLKVYRALSRKRIIQSNNTFPKRYVSEQDVNIDTFISFLESLQ